MTRIDALGPDEGERLRRLRLAALQADPDSFYRTFAEEVDQPLSFWDAWLARDGACVVVAVLDGRDVGLGACRSAPRRSPSRSPTPTWPP